MTIANNHLKPVFTKTFSYLTLGIFAFTNSPRLVLAEVDNSVRIRQQQGQILAQLSDGNQERSQLVQTANALLNQGDLTGAEENLRKLIQKFPKDAFGRYQLGNVLFRQGKKEDAIKEYQEAIKLNSKYAVAHNAIGIVLASEQRWEEAIAEYQKALDINPKYGDALTYLAQAQWEQGKRNEAIASLEKALSVFKTQNRPEKVQRIEKILREIKIGDDPTIS